MTDQKTIETAFRREVGASATHKEFLHKHYDADPEWEGQCPDGRRVKGRLNDLEGLCK